MDLNISLLQIGVNLLFQGYSGCNEKLFSITTIATAPPIHPPSTPINQSVLEDTIWLL
jgi:hypothetical protein